MPMQMNGIIFYIDPKYMFVKQGFNDEGLDQKTHLELLKSFYDQHFISHGAVVFIH